MNKCLFGNLHVSDVFFLKSSRSYQLLAFKKYTIPEEVK